MIGVFTFIITVEMQKNRTKIYTVSQVNSLIKVALEENLPSRLVVRGEVTNWTIAGSGHCYFSLKDEKCLLPCVMWASKYKSVKFTVEDGIAVLGTGHIDVYMDGGKYQLYVDKLQPEGVGALQLAFDQMVKKLKAEGLFDEKYKKPLPCYPQRIGILTSESGAAIEDIKDSIWSRWPCTGLFLYPVPVQGEGAARKIAAAIRDINRRNKKFKFDILIVGRGGGSLEDLWAFNEEVLARAIFDSEIPVISAVGHEVDITIADLVADARASTPTKAGVVAVPDMYEVLGDLENKENRLKNKVTALLEFWRQNLQTILASAVFRNPLLPVHNREQQLDEISIELDSSVRKLLTGAKEKLHKAYEQIIKLEPHRLLREDMLTLSDLEHKLRIATQAILSRNSQVISTTVTNLKDAAKSFLSSMDQNLRFRYEQIIKIRPEKLLRLKIVDLNKLQNKSYTAIVSIINGGRIRLTAQENRLAGLNPKLVLKRGYSITKRKDGFLVKKPDDIEIGDSLVTELANENSIESKVTKKQNKGN